ncbi:hemerythrin domain-containing protein [Saccharopolyspora sp. NPDC003752]
MTRATRHSGGMVDVLVTDHREVEQAFADYERGGLSDEQRRELVDHIITELVRHSVAEEQYLYPTARETLPNGDEVADKEIAEHAEAEEVMKRLESMDVADAGFDDLMAQLIRDIRQHVEEEERDLFPRLEQACNADELMDLGKKIQAAKKTAPTRPHPSAPDRPPANMILDPGVGMIDRMRDALSGRNR